MALPPPRRLPGPRRCRGGGRRWRRPRGGRLSAATALPPVASIGSTINTRVSARPPGTFESYCEAIAVLSSRCRPMWPTRASGSISSTASSMPRPARRTGTHQADLAREPAALRQGPTGVRTVAAFVGKSRVASSEQQKTDAAREPAELLRASRGVTQAHEHIALRDRVIENMQRHATHYTTPMGRDASPHTGGHQSGPEGRANRIESRACDDSVSV